MDRSCVRATATEDTDAEHAAPFLQAMFGDVSAGGNYPIAKPGGNWRSLMMETVLTAILVSVILNTATSGGSIGHNAAIAVGSTVALLGLFASPISGASMNPARTLGPDIVGHDYTGWWIYILGPVIGAAIAVAIIGAVRGLPDKEEQEAAQGGALPILGSPKAQQIKGGTVTAPAPGIPGYIAGTWDIDPVRSHIGFAGRHMVIIKVCGHFGKFESRIVTAEDPLRSSATFTAEMNSANREPGSR